MTLLGWRWAIARPYRSSVLMHGCSRLQAVHSASMVATPLPCVPTWKFEVYDLPDQDVLDKGYMDTDDAVYLTFHSLEQGGRCNSLTSLALSFIFHLTVADSACLAGELVGDINGGQPLPALFLRADLPSHSSDTSASSAAWPFWFLSLHMGFAHDWAFSEASNSRNQLYPTKDDVWYCHCMARCGLFPRWLAFSQWTGEFLVQWFPCERGNLLLGEWSWPVAPWCSEGRPGNNQPCPIPGGLCGGE